MYSRKSNANNRRIAKNTIVRILVILGLIVTVIVAGCVGGEKSENGVTPTPQKTPEAIDPEVTSELVEPEVTPATNSSSDGDGMIEKYNLDKLISLSDNIVIGEVTDVLRSEWNTQDGNKPVSSDSSNVIYTDAHINVEEYLKNKLDTTNITVRVLGGIIGQDRMDVGDQPSYNKGEKVLIFLKKDDDDRTKDIGDQHFVTVGAVQGKVSISPNNEVVIGDAKMSIDELRVIIAGKGTKSTTTVTN